MIVHKSGNYTWAFSRDALNCPLVILLGWKNKRFRLDLARRESYQGWRRTVTTVKAWRLEYDRMYTISHYYLYKKFVH